MFAVICVENIVTHFSLNKIHAHFAFSISQPTFFLLMSVVLWSRTPCTTRVLNADICFLLFRHSYWCEFRTQKIALVHKLWYIIRHILFIFAHTHTNGRLPSQPHLHQHKKKKKKHSRTVIKYREIWFVVCACAKYFCGAVHASERWSVNKYGRLIGTQPANEHSLERGVRAMVLRIKYPNKIRWILLIAIFGLRRPSRRRHRYVDTLPSPRNFDFNRSRP